MRDKTVKGILWSGYIGECKNKCPCYLIPEPEEDEIFLCEILRQKEFVGKEVEITVRVLDNERQSKKETKTKS